MDRRGYLRTVATGTTVAVAGCAGGEVVHSVSNKVLTIRRGKGWMSKIPANADQIKYAVSAQDPFDVFVFTDPDDASYYRTYLKGREPEQEPVGDEDLGGRATTSDGQTYMISTKDQAREDLPGSGPAYFAVDHSEYGKGTVPREKTRKIRPKVTLEAVESTLPI